MGDLMGCYVKKSAEAFIASDANTNNVVLDDGNYHVFALDFTGSEFDEGEDAGGPSKIKVKVNKDSSGNVTSFEMFSCETRNGSDVQTQYVLQTVQNGEFSLELIGGYVQDTSVGDFQITASAPLNSDGELDGQKTIVMQETHTWNGTDTGSSKLTGIQTSSQMTIYGFQTGDWSNAETDTSGSYTNQLYGINELLDTNVDGEDYNIKLLALGDGAVKGLFSGDDGSDSWSDSVTEAFSADTTQSTTFSESEFADDVSDATLPEVETITISFSDSQTWDCSDEADGTINFANIGVDLSSCENYQLGHNWINCYQLIQSEGGGEGEE